jgi:hypothetical protein
MGWLSLFQQNVFEVDFYEQMIKSYDIRKEYDERIPITILPRIK